MLLNEVKGYSHAKVQYFHYPAKGENQAENQIWFAVKYETQNTWTYVYISSSPKNTLDDTKLDGIFDEFDEKNPTLFNNESQFVCGVEFIIQKFAKWSTKKRMHKYQFFYGYPYYLEKKKSEPVENYNLPKDFYFDKPNMKTDPTIILENYPHSIPQNEDSMKAKIEKLPCAIVRHRKTNDLASYYMVDPLGFLTLQFTLPQYRGRGLRKAVELKLIKECQNYGLPLPFKVIELYNQSLITSHKASKIWKQWEEEDGTPIKITFAVTKKLHL